MKHIISIASLFLLAATFGCGPRELKTDYVEGTITYKGAPVDKAMVNFSPASAGVGSAATGTTDAQGKYQLKTKLGGYGKGTTPGEYKVTVSKSGGTPTGEMGVGPDGSEYPIISYKQVIPPIYDNVSTTPLTATVKSGEPNVFDFELVDGAK